MDISFGWYSMSILPDKQVQGTSLTSVKLVAYLSFFARLSRFLGYMISRIMVYLRGRSYIPLLKKRIFRHPLPYYKVSMKFFLACYKISKPTNSHPP